MFSVVVPVWNARATLRRTVETALAQSYREFELIVVDDGSTDGSIEMLAGLDDKRLRIVAQSNAGPGAARNRGIAEARHDWVAFLDADDLWLPDHLAELDRIRTAYPDSGLIGTRFITSDRRGRFRARDQGGGVIERVCLFDRIGRGEALLHTSSAAAPTSLLRRLGGFGAFPRGEDSELWARVALDHPVARSTKPTVVYVQGTNGVTDNLPTAWGLGPPRRTEDISPAVALVLAPLPSITSSERRDAIERYVERYLDWTVRDALARGDVATVRALGGFHRRPPSTVHRAIRAAALLPSPLAMVLARLIVRGQAATRRLIRLGRWFANARGRAREAPRPSRSAG